MNQAIYFPDLEQWNTEHQSVCIPALVVGLVYAHCLEQESLFKARSGIPKS